MAIHEECGVFGAICPEPADVGQVVYYGLYALQHRGQESCGIGPIKNKYVGRTFIAPGQEHRMDQVRLKLSAVRESIAGKRAVLVDDSIVRGTTSARIAGLLRKAGAKDHPERCRIELPV